MMHQIRTPLNIIGGFSQVLEENFHELPDDEAANIIRMMQDASRRILRIVRMLVASSAVDGQQTVSRESFSCNGLCREIVGAFRLTSPHTVKLQFDTDVPDDLMICSDKEKVTEILNELLENANKFTQLGMIILTCSQPDWQTVTFTVSDTGIGVAEADRPHRRCRGRPPEDILTVCEGRLFHRRHWTGSAVEPADSEAPWR